MIKIPTYDLDALGCGDNTGYIDLCHTQGNGEILNRWPA